MALRVSYLSSRTSVQILDAASAYSIVSPNSISSLSGGISSGYISTIYTCPSGALARVVVNKIEKSIIVSAVSFYQPQASIFGKSTYASCINGIFISNVKENLFNSFQWVNINQLEGSNTSNFLEGKLNGGFTNYRKWCQYASFTLITSPSFSSNYNTFSTSSWIFGLKNYGQNYGGPIIQSGAGSLSTVEYNIIAAAMYSSSSSYASQISTQCNYFHLSSGDTMIVSQLFALSFVMSLISSSDPGVVSASSYTSISIYASNLLSIIEYDFIVYEESA